MKTRDKVLMKEQDKNYLASGNWRCKSSPIKAHYWIGTPGFESFQCLYCKLSKNMIIDYEKIDYEDSQN